MLEHNQEQSSPEAMQAAWRDLLALIDESGVRTGIADLAEQHDHYLYGTEKREQNK